MAPVCTPCNTCFFEPVRVHNPNGISIGSAIFAHLTVECCRACLDVSFPLKIAPSHGAIQVAMLYNGPPILPSKLPLPMGYLDPHLIHGSLSPQPKQHLNQFSRFCRVHGNYVRLTDHATGSVTIGCIYVHSTAMPPNTTSHFFLIGRHTRTVLKMMVITLSYIWFQSCNLAYYGHPA